MGKVVKKPIKSTKKKNDNQVVSAQLKKQIKVKTVKRLSKQKPERGVILVKHLPSEFCEPEIQKYFQQFGKITRIRLARSERTGNTKRYAFVEFEVPEVAQIAAASMDNYLMFKKLVKTIYIPPAQQKLNHFRKNVRLVQYNGKLVPVSKITKRQNQSVRQNNSWTISNYQIRTNKTLNKIENLKTKYAALGLNLEDIVVKPATAVLKKISTVGRNLSNTLAVKSVNKQSGVSKKSKSIKKKLDFKTEQSEVTTKKMEDKSDKIKKLKTNKKEQNIKTQNKKIDGKN